MKTLLLFISILLSVKSVAQNADAITGKWMNIPKQNLIITVYGTGNTYTGKVNWVKDNDKVKTGFIILEKLVFNESSRIWDRGKIHSPTGGGTYNAIAKIKDDGTLEVHAYKGFKFLGKDKIFKRVKSD